MVRPRRGIEAILVLLEGLVVIGAVGGAAGLAWNGLGMGPEVLEATPFSAWWQAGLALLIVNGVLPALVLWGAVRHDRWAPWGHLAYGLVLLGWIVAQVGFIGLVSVLQPAFGAVGLSIAMLALLDLAPGRSVPG